MAAVLDALDPDSFREIRDAIDAHEAAMVEERIAAKNPQGGEIPSSAISPSPNASAGA
jgi:hypothetical protein